MTLRHCSRWRIGACSTKSTQGLCCADAFTSSPARLAIALLKQTTSRGAVRSAIYNPASRDGVLVSITRQPAVLLLCRARRRQRRHAQRRACWQRQQRQHKQQQQQCRREPAIVSPFITQRALANVCLSLRLVSRRERASNPHGVSPRDLLEDSRERRRHTAPQAALAASSECWTVTAKRTGWTVSHSASSQVWLFGGLCWADANNARLCIGFCQSEHE
jgi:hypothetical protein